MQLEGSQGTGFENEESKLKQQQLKYVVSSPPNYRLTALAIILNYFIQLPVQTVCLAVHRCTMHFGAVMPCILSTGHQGAIHPVAKITL